MDSFNELWQVVSDYLRQTNSESIYNVSFSELEPISFDGSRAVLMTTAEFKRRILAQKFGGTLHSAFLNALGLDVDVEFIAPGEDIRSRLLGLCGGLIGDRRQHARLKLF